MTSEHLRKRGWEARAAGLLPPFLENSSGQPWLGLIIGNSRLHWAEYQGATLVTTWDTPHSPPASELPPQDQPLRFASVVPSQTHWLQTHWPPTHLQAITLDDIPLSNTYPSFGVDRALALWGAGQTYGWPVLAIDGGTALTLTAGSPKRQLIGGAILPGLRLQCQSLGQQTAELGAHLPRLLAGGTLPQRWAMGTEEAIASGILYTLQAGLRAFVADWWQRYPGSWVILTGGDAVLLQQLLQALPWEGAVQDLVIADGAIAFKGLAALPLNLPA